MEILSRDSSAKQWPLPDLHEAQPEGHLFVRPKISMALYNILLGQALSRLLEIYSGQAGERKVTSNSSLRDGPVFKTNLGESSTKKALRCSTSNNVSGQNKCPALTIAEGQKTAL